MIKDFDEVGVHTNGDALGVYLFIVRGVGVVVVCDVLRIEFPGVIQARLDARPVFD